jgi:serine/threonine-protein kinase
MGRDPSLGEFIREHWPRLSELLDEALDLGHGDREVWLAKTVEDSRMREALAELLRDSDTEGAIDVGSERFARVLIADVATAEAASASWIGRALGPYRIVRLIGEGGMASVFLAERNDGGFAQLVAIKVLRHGMLDPYEQRRFLRERQILARLEHPGIARLIDGGLTAEGVPWFAMEYVQGLPITRYCDERRLSIDARLTLFLKVCDAVTCAHSALIVHRDIKPSNILATADGSLKLLDFGIARLVDDTDRIVDDSTATMTTQRRLTPAYAAPEQWRGGLVITSADVYALGVLLHELLIGFRPSRREDDSLRLPSSLIGQAADRAVLAQQRGSSPGSLRQRVAGDLDMILTVALHADPARRYRQATALAEDVHRHMQQRPVSARPDAFFYRAGRYLRRHRVAVIAASLVLASIAIGVFTTLQQARQAREAAAAAQREAGRAEAVKDFLLGLFTAAAPNQSKGRGVTARELLDLGARGLRESMSETPALRTELQLVLAGIYRELGEYGDASELLASIDPAVSSDKTEVELETARLEFAQGRYEPAENAVRAALAALLPDDPIARETRSSMLVLLAEILAARDRKDEAETAVREAIALDEAIAGPQGSIALLALARDQAVLGQIAFGRGDLDGAEQAMHEALRLRERQLGETHTSVATAQHDLAVIQLQRGQVEAAQPLFEQALRTRKQLLGPRHVEIASTLLNLGALKRRQGDREAAKGNYDEAAAMLRALFPGGHPELAAALNSLAVLAQESGDIATAIERMQEAIALSKKMLGEHHPNVGIMLGNLASMHRMQGDYPRAAIVQRDGLALLERAVGQQHHLYGVALNGLAFIELESGDAALAGEHFRQAAAIIDAALGETHADYGAVLTGLSEAELTLSEKAKALADARKAMAIVNAALPAGHPRQRRTMVALSEALAANDDCAAALDELDKLGEPSSPTEKTRSARLRADCAGASDK